VVTGDAAVLVTGDAAVLVIGGAVSVADVTVLVT